MIIINGIQKFNRDLGKVVATIGNFDGVHLGHQQIIKKVIEEGNKVNLKKVLFTFEPHPTRIIFPSKAPRLILNRHQKIRILEELGIDVLFFIPFDRDLSLMTAEEFLKNLMEKITFDVIYIGENFRFGKNRSADFKTLAALGEKLGFRVGCVPFVKMNDIAVSSSLVRDLLGEGKVEEASQLLGRPYSVEGKVVPGVGRGKKINIPTANIQAYNEIIPKRGTYISEIIVGQLKFKSVTNIGIRPTFPLSSQTIESHIIDFNDHIYGEKVEVFFHQRIRDEVKFENIELLKKRIQQDIEKMKAFFLKKDDSLFKK